jgi:hypothetical protein
MDGADGDAAGVSLSFLWRLTGFRRFGGYGEVLLREGDGRRHHMPGAGGYRRTGRILLLQLHDGTLDRRVPDNARRRLWKRTACRSGCLAARRVVRMRWPERCPADSTPLPAGHTGCKQYPSACPSLHASHLIRFPREKRPFLFLYFARDKQVHGPQGVPDGTPRRL